MRICVCVKQVISPESSLRVSEEGTWLREDHVSWELNEPDAYALEEALRLRERHGGEVIALSAGPVRVVQVLREALARGADRAIHVRGDHLASADPFTVASALATVLVEEQPDLVLTGLQSDDQGFAQVGVMLSEHLRVAHATIVMAIELESGSVRVKRELEGGWFQWVRLPMPAVLTIQSGINQLRYATLKGIMAARKKAIREVAAQETGPADVPRIVRITAPSPHKQTVFIDGTPSEIGTTLVTALKARQVI